jgi:hypothetical protein
MNLIGDDSRSVDSSHTDVETLDDLRPESLFQKDKARPERSRAKDRPDITNHDSSIAPQSSRGLQGLGTQYVSLP